MFLKIRMNKPGLLIYKKYISKRFGHKNIMITLDIYN